MAASKPEPSQVLQAVDTYVRLAYDDHLPLPVRSQLSVLKSWKGEFYRSPAIAADKEIPPRRYTIRLGNRHYPHMKLAIERSPDDQSYLFRVDTHDGHFCPPADNPEYEAFLKLMDENQHFAQAIEAAWAAEKIPTFKTFLREDLARRQGKTGD
jgi:hypothetical protein